MSHSAYPSGSLTRRPRPPSVALPRAPGSATIAASYAHLTSRHRWRTAWDLRDLLAAQALPERGLGHRQRGREAGLVAQALHDVMHRARERAVRCDIER